MTKCPHCGEEMYLKNSNNIQLRYFEHPENPCEFKGQSFWDVQRTKVLFMKLEKENASLR